MTVIGSLDLISGHCQQAEKVHWPSGDATGSDIVVIADSDQLEAACDLIVRRAPAAVVVVTDPGWCEEVLRRTRFPRGRVIATADVAAVIDAVLGESGAALDVVVRHDGEAGRQGFGPARARVGAGGVLAILG
ncbi:MAG: hypothetical protein QOH62_1492 [Solirubrobacteraceae bacterium]|nr:hypothetical protein [Solirubrobacteraceae bacterium]